MTDRIDSIADPLELSGAEFQALVNAATERIVSHVESLSSQPAADVAGGTELARSLVEPLPETGSPVHEVLDLIFDRAVPKSFNTAGPGYLAYIPGGGILHSAVADLIADAVNRYVGVWIAAPALAQLEANVVRWFCEIMGLGEGASGFLTSGGSLANFSALVTARRTLLGDDFLSGTIYASDQVHHSVVKAAMLAGFPAENVRQVASDAAFRIRNDELERLIDGDREQEMRPFMVVGSAGTTNTGAVDDLSELAQLASKHDMWFHVDAAYGGFFMLTARGRRAMRGIERADSVVLDPHKGLFLPYGTGSLLVRDRAVLRRAHSVFADYMPPMQDDEELIDFCQVSPELSRPFRGLGVWLPVKLMGIEPFRNNLDEKLDLAAWAADELGHIPGIEIVAEPQLSIVAFRLDHPGLDVAGLNRLNQDLLEEVNSRRRVYLTGTMLDGRFTIRICVLSFRTHLDRMEQGLEDIRAAVGEALGRWRTVEDGGGR
jgi:aromatic-L-amino-acid decarboxylase